MCPGPVEKDIRLIEAESEQSSHRGFRWTGHERHVISEIDTGRQRGVVWCPNDVTVCERDLPVAHMRRRRRDARPQRLAQRREGGRLPARADQRDGWGVVSGAGEAKGAIKGEHGLR